MTRIIIAALLALTVSTPALAQQWTKPTKNWVEMSPQEKRELVALRVKEVSANPELRAWMEKMMREKVLNK